MYVCLFQHNIELITECSADVTIELLSPTLGYVSDAKVECVAYVVHGLGHVLAVSSCCDYTL